MNGPADLQPWPHYRAKIASLTRSRADDDPELLAARRDLRAARLFAHVEKALAGEPALTMEQREDIARLVMDRA